MTWRKGEGGIIIEGRISLDARLTVIAVASLKPKSLLQVSILEKSADLSIVVVVVPLFISLVLPDNSLAASQHMLFQMSSMASQITLKSRCSLSQDRQYPVRALLGSIAQ